MTTKEFLIKKIDRKLRSLEYHRNKPHRPPEEVKSLEESLRHYKAALDAVITTEETAIVFHPMTETPTQTGWYLVFSSLPPVFCHIPVYVDPEGGVHWNCMVRADGTPETRYEMSHTYTLAWGLIPPYITEKMKERFMI